MPLAKTLLLPLTPMFFAYPIELNDAARTLSIQKEDLMRNIPEKNGLLPITGLFYMDEMYVKHENHNVRNVQATSTVSIERRIAKTPFKYR